MNTCSKFTISDAFLDWLSFSLTTSPIGRLPLRFADSTARPIHPRAGYDIAVGLLPAGRMDWHTKRPAQGFGVQFSGGDFDLLHEGGNEDVSLLRWVSQLGGKASRLDVAVDLHGLPGLAVNDLVQAYEGGNARTSVHKWLITRGLGATQGATVYAGSPTSDFRLRVYDKGAETGLGGDWVRVELQLRRVLAQAFLTYALAYGLMPAFRSFLSRSVDFPTVDWFQSVLAGETAPKPILARPPSATELWLERQVLPALRRLAVVNPSLLLSFVTKVNSIAEKISHVQA